jgi:hypothetical protein
MIGLRSGFPAARVVRAEQEPVHDRARLLGVGQGVVEDPGESPSNALGRFGNRGGGGAERVSVELACRPEADEHDSPGGRVSIRVEQSRPPDRRTHVFLLGDTLGILVAREGG